MRSGHGTHPLAEASRPPHPPGLRRGAVLLAALAALAGPVPATGRVAAAPANPVNPTSPPAPTATFPPPSPSPPTTAGAPATTAPPVGDTWTLLAGGDTLLTRPLLPSTAPFRNVRPALGSADLALVNVETAISTRGRAAVKQYTFRSPPTFAGLLAAAGVDVASLANNHSLDFGRDALDDTIGSLTAAGISPVGAGADETRARAAAHRVVRGTRIAVVAASQIIPDGTWPAAAGHPGIASAGKHRIDAYTQALLAGVRAERATNDVVIVFLHWGIEGSPCPSPVQRTLADLLHEAGASVVIGAHPHVLQPIVRTADGGLTAYSLGNFIWDPRSGATADTGVLEVRFRGAAVYEVVFHPHRLDGAGWASADLRSGDRARIEARVFGACRNVR